MSELLSLRFKNLHSIFNDNLNSEELQQQW